jgi:hypothetical protein
MFQSRENKVIQGKFKKSAKGQRYPGANRRATGLLPEPSGEHGKEMLFDKYADYTQLFAAIKANQQTCCIKFSSETQKSRGAILIFQGRVLGAIYGRKDLDGKLFHQEAFALALKDISQPDVELVGHVLSEALAVATASLFHGEFGEASEHKIGQNAFSQCYANLTDSKKPGCILVHDNEDLTVFAAYFFDGRMVALYSGMEGWLPATIQVAFQKMATRGEVKVTSTVLKVDNIKEVTELTFALSELDDRLDQNRASSAKRSHHSIAPLKNGVAESSSRDLAPSVLVGKKNPALRAQELMLRQRLAHLAMG